VLLQLRQKEVTLSLYCNLGWQSAIVHCLETMPVRPREFL